MLSLKQCESALFIVHTVSFQIFLTSFHGKLQDLQQAVTCIHIDAYAETADTYQHIHMLTSPLKITVDDII